VLSIALACVYPRLWFVPCLLQLTSVVGYAPFLFGAELFPLHTPSFLASLGAPTGAQVFGGLIRAAGIVNWLMFGLLSIVVVRALASSPGARTSDASLAAVR
jgi:hypothetical protein